MTQVILHLNIQNGSNPIESSNFWIVIHTSLPFKLCWFCTSNVKHCFTYLFILTNMIQYTNETQTMFYSKLIHAGWVTLSIIVSISILNATCNIQLPQHVETFTPSVLSKHTWRPHPTLCATTSCILSDPILTPS